MHCLNTSALAAKPVSARSKNEQNIENLLKSTSWNDFQEYYGKDLEPVAHPDDTSMYFKLTSVQKALNFWEISGIKACDVYNIIMESGIEIAYNAQDLSSSETTKIDHVFKVLFPDLPHITNTHEQITEIQTFVNIKLGEEQDSKPYAQWAQDTNQESNLRKMLNDKIFFEKIAQKVGRGFEVLSEEYKTSQFFNWVPGESLDPIVRLYENQGQYYPLFQENEDVNEIIMRFITPSQNTVRESEPVLVYKDVQSFWKTLKISPERLYEMLIDSALEAIKEYKASYHDLVNMPKLTSSEEYCMMQWSDTSYEAMSTPHPKKKDNLEQNLSRWTEAVLDYIQAFFRKDSDALSADYNRLLQDLKEKAFKKENMLSEYYILDALIADYREDARRHFRLWQEDGKNATVHMPRDKPFMTRLVGELGYHQDSPEFKTLLQNLNDHPSADDRDPKILQEIEQNREKNFLGQPIFVPKNAKNMSNTVSWKVFSEHYAEAGWRRLLEQTIEGKKCYTLPHYAGGDCLWQVLGIPVEDVYELVATYASDLLDQYSELQNRFDERYPIILSPLNDSKEKVEQKKEEKETEEQQKTRIERQQLAEEVSSAAYAVVEVFDFFYPKDPETDPMVRTTTLKELIAQHQRGNIEHKLTWIEGVKKHGGRAIDSRVGAGAFRPPHSIHFFQKAAEYLGVNIQLVRDEIQMIHLPDPAQASVAPLLRIHGTMHHYQPLIVEDDPVSLAVIQNARNFLQSHEINKASLYNNDDDTKNNSDNYPERETWVVSEDILNEDSLYEAPKKNLCDDYENDGPTRAE